MDTTVAGPSPSRTGPGFLLLPILFAMTLFASATLLFLMQPLFARKVLPLLGGSPAVWNTCMVFYQAALLAGYAYAHFSTRFLGLRRQTVLHLALMLLPLLVLPIAIPSGWRPPTESNPIPWLLALLFVSVALPFTVVSTSAPLFQRWFSASGHPDAPDPYFLYSASNAGSLLALLAYPLLLEPNLKLSEQSDLWAWGYGLLVVQTCVCVVLLWWFAPAAVQSVRQPTDTAPLPRWMHLRWLVYSMLPAGLLPAVTTHITTDVAAIPLLWVLPLMLYLLSFILVFTGPGKALHPWMIRLMPLGVLVLIYFMLLRRRPDLVIEIELHLAVFFLIAMVCHGELARLRPGPGRLTEYFLCLSLGGVLGGLLIALLAPLVFPRTLEYPLSLACAGLLCPSRQAIPSTRFQRLLDLLLPLGLGLLTAGIALTLNINGLRMDTFGQEPEDILPWILWLWAMGLPVGVCFAFTARPLRFGLCVGAVMLTALVCADWRDGVECRARSFFAQLSVQKDPKGEYRWLLHGTTLHGWQSLKQDRRDEPLTYFHRTGPVGQVFAARQRIAEPRHIGVTGLGIGSMAAYARRGQEWTFYEIDPAIKQIALNPDFFTYLSDAEQRGVDLRIVLGDARLRLQDAPAEGYDLLFLDAFSSDSVPVHLLTVEALELYLSKLKKDGWLIYNISNRYLELEWVLARQMRKCGLVGYVQFDDDIKDKPGKTPSKFVILARSQEVLDLTGDSRWQPLRERADVGLWTDDFSNLLSVFRWAKKK
jgi:SAM-dependent methyltransferase